jgi:hypothetical protein
MPKPPNGTPGKKPPAPSVSTRGPTPAYRVRSTPMTGLRRVHSYIAALAYPILNATSVENFSSEDTEPGAPDPSKTELQVGRQ